jgi:hypothetical protein
MMSSINGYGAARGTRGRAFSGVALVMASMCLALIAGPGSALAAQSTVRAGAQTPPPGVPATIPASQLTGGGVMRPLGGYGWQTVVAASLTLRSSPGGATTGTLIYGDQFYTDTISGSWCHGDAYYNNGVGYTYYGTGWVLCDYLHKN